MTLEKDLHLIFPPFRVMFISDFVFHQILAIFGATLYISYDAFSQSVPLRKNLQDGHQANGFLPGPSAQQHQE